MNLQTKNFDLVQMPDGSYKAFVFDKLLCRRMDKLLNEYPDYSFQDGEEGIFHFSSGQLTHVKKALKIKGS